MLLSARVVAERMVTVIVRWVSHFIDSSILQIQICMKGIPMTKKKFAELELSLLHLQQNVEIPETHLVIHPVIQRAVEQVQLFLLMIISNC
jgi:hypothetical protein